MECAMQCILLQSACAGIMYNNELFSCKVVKCYLNDRSVNSTKMEVGWEIWFQNTVCPVGWVPFDGHCYFLNETKRNWNDAKEQCEHNEAHLVEIETLEENTWIMETFLSPWNDVDCPNWWDCCDFWIGATDMNEEGVFTWNRRINVTFTNWNELQPDNLLNAHCAFFCRNGRWYDVLCEDPNTFICEKE
ncbi:perlucin-like protein [Saccostrea cucullata]|uniref:perlucin-like protein n=1 Tax=Saccostrea cuccullata TaxID=36930 RepID=UPI002ED558C8